MRTLTDDAIRRARRLCLFSHWDAEGQVDDYVLRYLREIRNAGFTIVFVTTAALSPDAFRRVEPLCKAVVQRENEGLDFGGWIECLRRWPDLTADLLLLCNDSVYGPFWNLADFISDLTSKPADFYGAVLSLDGGPHLQSWFVLLRPAAYRSAGFRSLVGEPMPAKLSKIQIIERYERGLSRRLFAEGLGGRAAFDPREIGPISARHPLDPAMTLWRELLDHRLVPFIKIRLLRDRPIPMPGARSWRRLAARLDPEAAEMATRNLARRTRATRRIPALGLRKAVGWPALPLAQQPFARRALAREMRLRPSAEAPNRIFETLGACFDLLRVPYALLYKGIGARRRGNKAGD